MGSVAHGLPSSLVNGLSWTIPNRSAPLNSTFALRKTDFLALLANWGPCPEADFDGSGDVGVSDLLILLAESVGLISHKCRLDAARLWYTGPRRRGRRQAGETRNRARRAGNTLRFLITN